jgi:hypothetical protein
MKPSLTLLTRNYNRAITSFALEKFPCHATVVSAIINMWRTSGGFSVPYFQPSVVAAGVLITILPVYIRENPRRRNESEHEAPNGGGDIGDQSRSEDGQE